MDGVGRPCHPSGRADPTHLKDKRILAVPSFDNNPVEMTPTETMIEHWISLEEVWARNVARIWPSPPSSADSWLFPTVTIDQLLLASEQRPPQNPDRDRRTNNFPDTNAGQPRGRFYRVDGGTGSVPHRRHCTRHGIQQPSYTTFSHSNIRRGRQSDGVRPTHSEMFRRSRPRNSGFILNRCRARGTARSSTRHGITCALEEWSAPSQREWSARHIEPKRDFRRPAR